MKKLTPTLLAALLLIGLCWTPHKEAQDAPAGSDGLKARADAVKDALLSGTVDELFGSFAPWLQGRAKLFKSDFVSDVDAEIEETVQQAMLRTVKEHDPADILELKEVKDVKNLTAAQLAGLWLEYYTLRDEKFSSARKDADWFEVDRRVATKSVGEGEGETVGRVIYMSPQSHDAITVQAVQQDGAWYVTGLKCAIGELIIDSDKSPLSPAILKLKEMKKETFRLKRSEAEILMGAARDYCRVEYSKTEKLPKNLGDGLKDSTVEEEFGGTYFNVRDAVYNDPDKKRGAVVADPVEDESLGYGALYFNDGDGTTDIKWYDTKDALDKALKAFQTAK